MSELASDENPNHTVHVVSGLEPAEALEILGAKPRLFQPCELPDGKPDRWTSLPAAALGIESGASGALLAGRIGEWTFVYDDSMATDHLSTPSLSANGRSAATSMFSIHANASLSYFVNSEQLAWIDIHDDLEENLPSMPADLRAAFDAAGIFGLDGDVEPGKHDDAILMRAVCALAGLTCTLSDLRRIPLLVTAFG
ncbi:hypothetical protein [Lentzea flava]|uniref:hypothetical protein n=1 Tax=Lentzea flava TaxID=103732 RepID=UPI00227D9263|nr:hypothetical protein [Lentzea flava]